MKTNLPMAIEPSINDDCNFQLIKLPNCNPKNGYIFQNFVIEVNSKTIHADVAYLLGIGEGWCTEYIGGKNNYTYCQYPADGFHHRKGTYRGITLEQLQILWEEALEKCDVVIQYKPILTELIETQILPLFNPVVKFEPAQNKQSHKFHSDLFGDLTVLTHDDGSLWFIGKEVAEKLGYKDTKDAIARHCKGAVKHRLPVQQSVTGYQDMSIIPERDVYRLVMRSKLPTAEKFEEFVVSEVLPSIRKTGSYGQIAAPTVSQPAELSRKDLLLMALRSEEEKEQLQFERDEAVRCKSWISESREASAMGKLARANDKVRQLEAKLAIVNQAPEYAYATVLAIQSRLKHLKVSGLKLTYYCRNNGLLVKDIPDERYGVVHSYPAAAWQNVYQIDINNVLNKVA